MNEHALIPLTCESNMRVVSIGWRKIYSLCSHSPQKGGLTILIFKRLCSSHPTPCKSIFLSSPRFYMIYLIHTYHYRYILADPTYEEEQLAISTLSIVHNTRGKLVSVVKPGGVLVTEQSLRECIARAQERVQEVAKLVDKACEAAKVSAMNKVM